MREVGTQHRLTCRLRGQPIHRTQHVGEDSLSLLDVGKATEVTSTKTQFECGDILFGKLRPYFRKVGMAPMAGVCSTDILVAAAKSSEWFGFVLGHMTSTEFVDYADAGSTGTRMPRTNWNRMAQYEVTLPPSELAATLSAQVRPCVDSIVCTAQHSRNLRGQRDRLLPCLLTSAYTVKNVQEQRSSIR